MDESRTWVNHFKWPSWTWLVMLSPLTIIIAADIEILCRPSKRNQRHCVDTEKSLCTQGNSQEVLTLCQAVYSRKSSCVDTKDKGTFAQINLVSTIK